jgi:hypothetical protein
MEALRVSLAGTRVRLLNVEEPLAAKTSSWFPEYTVPNFQAVANQRTLFAALGRFAAQNNTDIVLRVITWREAADLLRTPGWRECSAPIWCHVCRPMSSGHPSVTFSIICGECERRWVFP